MKKRLGLFLAALMLMGSMAVSASSESTAAPNDVVYGYQKVDFENYSVGDKVITNGNNSADGKVNGSVGGSNTSDTSFVIAGDENNKYIKITDTDADGGNIVSFRMNNNDTALNDDMDYFVLKADVKNESVGLLQMIRAIRSDYSNGTLSQAGGAAVTISGSHTLSNYTDWNEFMFIGEKATGNLYVVANGEITNITAENINYYKNANDFYMTQFNTQYFSGTGSFYIDNMEMYGVKTSTNKVTCKLTAEANDNDTVYAEFNHPVNFTASNVSITSGSAAISSVTYENGKYKIKLANADDGYTLKVSGVTDVYESTCADTSLTVGKVLNKKIGYQKVDFENYKVGDKVITNGTNSADGKVQGYIGDTSINSFDESYVIAGDENNKYVKMIDKATSSSKGVNFKMMNKDEALNDDVDYFVLKADVKNGDNDANACVYLMTMRGIRYNNATLEKITGTWDNYSIKNARGWNNWMFIGDKANAKMYVVLNGEIIDVVCESSDYTTAEKFYGSQFSTVYSKGGTVYIDNMEMYGIKKEYTSNNCTITPNAENGQVEISFTNPTKLTADNIMISGDTEAKVSDLSFENGKYIATLSGIAANSSYSVGVLETADIFGVKSEFASEMFSTGSVEMAKTYLSTDARYTGKEDFEHYNTTGVFMSETGDNVAITDNNTGTKIEDIWSITTGTNGLVETSLVKEDANTMLKMFVADVGSTDEQTNILQMKPDKDWTNETKGKIYVYSAKFKSGGENETPFHSTSFGGGLRIYFKDGTAGFGSKQVKAFEPKEWVDFKYVIDWTGDVMKHYAVFNGVLIDTYSGDLVRDNVSSIWQSSPRFAQIYAAKNTTNCTIYFDDIETYTTSGIINNLTAEIAKDNVKCGEGAYVKFNFPVATLDVSSVNGATKTERLSDGSWNISFASALSEGENTITLSNVTDIYGNTLKTQTLTFNVVSGGTFEGITSRNAADGKVSVTTYNSGAPITDAIIAVAGYDNDGKLVGVEAKKAQTIGMGSNTFEFTNVGAADRYTAFVWNSAYAPLCPAK